MDGASRAATLGVAALLSVIGATAVCEAQPSQSSSVAKQMVAAMQASHLDAIAVRDPEAAGRYIAALVFPESQLLVVSAPAPAPAALDDALSRGQYRDVYTALQQASIKDGKLFIQDLGCDGLQPNGDGTADVVYQNVTKQTIFDGNWKRQHLSAEEYQQRFGDVDAQYSRMLTALLAATQTAPHQPATP